VGLLGRRSLAFEALVSIVEPGSSGIARFGFLADPEGRRRRGRRIAEALTAFGGLRLENARILDVGCSAGLVTAELAARAAWVVGVDVDAAAVRHAARAHAAPRFLVASGTQLPFADGAFDAVVCNHVYEHVADPVALMREIRRVLRPDGACYLATGHTLQLVEPHHRLPFLSWLPRPTADAVMRATGRGPRYEERFLPPWRLRSLAAGFAHAELVSPAMLRDPIRYEFSGIAALPPLLRAAVAALARPAALAAPTWIWLLRR
jgi:SAM-dependent methyltransferase